MKDVERDIVIKKGKLKKLLTKICDDLKIEDKEKVIENFLKNSRKVI